jgi:hypothetical protein
MKIVTLAGAAAALIASTLVSFAGTDTGTITKVEWGLGTITLDNGKIYIVPPTLLNTPAQSNLLTVGNKVKVTFEAKTISNITKA